MTNIFNEFQVDLLKLLDGMAADGALPRGLDFSRVVVEPPRDPAHGDLATNAAMVLSKPAGMKPRDLAERLAERLKGLAAVTGVEIAGPGFINLRLTEDFWRRCLVDILTAGTAYGDSGMGAGRKVNVEYVSANPTGPMHVGHGRGAVVGDALANLLAKAGFAVTREYYVNDAGAQVDMLARALYARYRVALGLDTLDDFKRKLENGEIQYGGDYLVTPAEELAASEGKKWADASETDWLNYFRAQGVVKMMAMIREDLALLGVKHDVFTSERELVAKGKVDEALAFLQSRGLIYEGVLEPPKGKPVDDWEPRPQTLFKATDFGDDVDRPLKKSDGSWTYFATDIAYHLDKSRRGFPEMIDVWGADHGGYVKRMQAAVKAATEGKGALDVKLCQMINLLQGGQPVKMSKRAGTFVTLKELAEEVGRDVVRFIMLTRKNDQHLDFDLEKVREQSRENPVFYVQYCHARAHSVLRHASEMFPDMDLEPNALTKADLACLTDGAELALIKRLAGWPRLVESAAEAHEPHRVAFYLYDLAAEFHGLWNKGRDEAELRFLLPEDRERSQARLAMVRSVALVTASGLAVMGVEPLEEMR